MLNGKQLRHYFAQLNAQYFGNRLPPYAIQVIRHISSLGEDGICNRKRRLIKIKHGLPDEEAIGTLLHEMAHAATSSGHGTQFRKEIVRLREAGAPLAEAEMGVCLDGPGGGRVTKQMFRNAVQELLVDSPDLDITLSDAIREYRSTYGGPDTVTGFKKKYPWAGAVLKQAKKESAEEQRRVAAFRLHFPIDTAG